MNLPPPAPRVYDPHVGLASKLVRRARSAYRDLAQYATLFDMHGNDVARQTDFAHAERPVLLLPGFLATRRTLAILERRLRRDGYSPFSLNLGGLLGTFNTLSIEERALYVREKIERLYQRFEKMGPLAIVGHSKGGLIGRYYVKRLGGHQRCCALITLGTPHNGAPIAYLGMGLGPILPSLGEMRPMSRFIQRLKEGTFPSEVRLVSVYSKDDRIATFPSTLLESDGQPHILNVDVRGVPHHGFLHNKRVYDVVHRELQIGFADAHPREPGLRVAPRAVEGRGTPKATG